MGLLFCAKFPKVKPVSEEPSVSNKLLFCVGEVNAPPVAAGAANDPKPFGLPNVGAEPKLGGEPKVVPPPNEGAPPKTGFANAALALGEPKVF